MLIASRRLGEFLIERRVLSRDLLEELLVRETAERTHLSLLLVETGTVSQKDLVAAIADQVGAPFVDLAEQPIRPDVHALVPEDLARGYLAVAVSRDGDAVVVALEDPSDAQVVSTIANDIGHPVVAAMAVRDDLERVIEEMYGPTVDSGGWEVEEFPGDLAAAAIVSVAHLRLDDILGRALDRHASDVHLTVGSAPAVRVDGQLSRLDGIPALSGSDVRRILFEVLTRRQREQFQRAGELETSHALPGRARFRLSAFLQRDSVAAVLRVVPRAVPTVDKLGLPDSVQALSELTRGLVIITGPARSGRSTTLAALVGAINAERTGHILTIEDPIEFLHQHNRSIVNQRQVGDDTQSVATAVRLALRHDPDVLVVGSVPDPETIATVLAAAEAGLLVFCTLPVPWAVDAVGRMIDVFPVDHQPQFRVQLASSLQAVVAQQLLPSRQGGRVLATEVLMGSPMVRDFLREGKHGQLTAAMSVGGDGMQTMEHSLSRLVQTGHVALDVALEHCQQPDELRRLARPMAGTPAASRITDLSNPTPDRESLRR